MPGTIRVSVLDFEGLLSPAPSSSLLIKASMGKNVYQISDMGDFSLWDSESYSEFQNPCSPLTTLRDKLIVTLQDSEGNEVSHACVQTMSIVEKGFWDDLFPLEGGGHVHMKLQFILSEEERNRIRTVRESALTKKHGESFNRSIEYAETAITIAGSVASPLSINHEVSVSSQDSERSIMHKEVASAGDVTIQADLPSSTVNKHESAQKQITLNSADRSEELLSVLKPQPHGALLEKNIETHLPHADIPTRPISSRQSSSPSECLEPVLHAMKKPVSQKLQDDSADKPEKQGPLQKTSSNVRKMITAFESSLAQDKVPVKPLEVKSQRNKVGMEGPVKDQTLKDLNKPVEFSSVKLKSPFLREGLCETSKHIKTEEHIGFGEDLGIIRPSQFLRQLKQSSAKKVQPEGTDAIMNSDKKSAQTEMNDVELQQKVTDTVKTGEFDVDKDLDGIRPSLTPRQLESSAKKIQSKGTDTSLKVETRTAQNDSSTKELEKSPEDYIRSSTLESPTIPVSKHDHDNSGGQPCNLEPQQRDSGGTSVARDGGNGVQPSNSEDIRALGASSENQLSVVHCEDGHHSYRNSSTWIPPDDTRDLCVTTGDRRVMDFLGGSLGESFEGKRSFFDPDNVGKQGLHCVTDAEITTIEKKSENLTKLRDESPVDDASHSGPFGQVIKIAVVIGFGLLVFLTRQREPRKHNRKANDRPFSTLACMDQEIFD